VKVWCWDDREDRTDASLLEVQRLRGVPLSSGRSVRGRFPDDIALEVRSRPDPDDFFRAGPAFVVSARLRDLFDRFGVAAEYHPLQVRHRRKAAPQHQYWFANLTCEADCLDWDRSAYTLEQGFAVTIRRLVLRPLGGPEPPLFYIARTIGAIVCASDRLAEAVVGAGYTGVRLVAPEQWHNPMWPPGMAPNAEPDVAPDRRPSSG
jgi:hypothetical protein